MNSQKINCPNCGHLYAVEEVLEKQLMSKLKKGFDEERNQLQQVLEKKELHLEQQNEAFENKKKRQNEIFSDRLLKARKEIHTEVEGEVKKSMESKMTFMSDQMEKREQEIQSLKKVELDVMKERAEMKKLKGEMELRVEKELLEARHAIEAATRLEESEKSKLKLREYEKQMNDLKEQLESAKKKAEQGSMQLQGEVQELVLEEELTKLFPFDQIEEVAKGIKGADVIHTVINNLNQKCGQIVYESKRTKAFSNEWIDKLKVDQRQLGADLAVIVTETMPRDMAKFGELKGVWICPFNDIKGVALLLRHSLIEIHNVKESQVNKGDKMELLYTFLTGSEFRGNLEAIVEGFNNMKQDLDKEKRAMERIWKTREKQIDKVITNTVHMYGSIRGIAGNAIGTIEQLELPGGEDDELV